MHGWEGAAHECRFVAARLSLFSGGSLERVSALETNFVRKSRSCALLSNAAVHRDALAAAATCFLAPKGACRQWLSLMHARAVVVALRSLLAMVLSNWPVVGEPAT